MKLQWDNNRTNLTKLVAFHCYCILCLITSQSSRLPSPWASCHPPWRWHRRSGAPREWIVPPRLMLCRWPQQRSETDMGTSAKSWVFQGFLAMYSPICERISGHPQKSETYEIEWEGMRCTAQLKTHGKITQPVVGVGILSSWPQTSPKGGLPMGSTQGV